MKRKYLLFIFAFVFLVLLVVSPDSYMHDVYAHFDTTIFHFYGKSMMNGLVPYKDFNECKGPLLLLIYGVGYLISNYNFIGAFWISVLAYFLIYYLTFKISILILEDKMKAILATILMTVFYFNPMVQYEVKTESFAQVFILASMYYTMRLIMNKKTNIRFVAFILGVSFSAAFLMKINIGAMICIFILFGFIYAIKNKYILNYILFGILGISCIWVPFIIYFIINDNFPQCISEFWYITNFTIKNYSGDSSYIQRLIMFFIEPVTLFVFISNIIGLFLFRNKNKKLGHYPIVCFLFFFFMTLQAGAFHYYYIVCNAFYIFLICAILKDFSISKSTLVSITCITFILVCSANLLRCWKGTTTEDFFLQDSPKRQMFYKYSYLMAQIKNPKFITTWNVPSWDVASGAIPGYKYPLEIVGEPKKISEGRWEAVKNGVDFVCIDKDKENDSITRKMISWGYKKYNYGGSSLYTKHKLKEAPKDFYVSAMDVLLKRDVLKSVRPK